MLFTFIKWLSKVIKSILVLKCLDSHTIKHTNRLLKVGLIIQRTGYTIRLGIIDSDPFVSLYNQINIAREELRLYTKGDET